MQFCIIIINRFPLSMIIFINGTHIFQMKVIGTHMIPDMEKMVRV